MIYLLCNEDLGSGLIRTQLLDKCIDDDLVICVCRPDKFRKQLKFANHIGAKNKSFAVPFVKSKVICFMSIFIFINWLIMLIPIYLSIGGLNTRQVSARGYGCITFNFLQIE